MLKSIAISPRRFGAGVVLALGATLLGCTTNGDQTATTGDGAVSTEDLPQVVATTSILCDLTEQVAEATIDLTCLMGPGQDPHTYQVRPSDRQAIEQADLILYDGYDFAPAIIAMVEDSDSAIPQVAVYEAAVTDPLLGEGHSHDHDHGHGDDHGHDHGHSHGHEEEDDHGHSHGHDEDDHGHDAVADSDLVPDPHIWHDATNNAAITQVIVDSLVELNPDQAELYQDNGDRIIAQFNDIDTWIQTQVATVPVERRQLVTTHDAFRYFAAAYGFEVKGALSGLSTEEQPTPGTMTSLVDQVKTAEVPAIFAETTTNPQLIETVATDAGVIVADQPLFVEGPGGPGTAAETTQDMLVVNTCTIVDALGGSCDRDSAPI
ncbi:MAG: metal ABC transporter substrate-binding protein [Leptolyngbya sp. LCM1.Bin17]|nr:MAG: metal ABC transporter substrate-binding protein [Leptolyngbya sp. LCM1.Bin17]